MQYLSHLVSPHVWTEMKQNPTLIFSEWVTPLGIISVNPCAESLKSSGLTSIGQKSSSQTFLFHRISRRYQTKLSPILIYITYRTKNCTKYGRDPVQFGAQSSSLFTKGEALLEIFRSLCPRTLPGLPRCTCLCGYHRKLQFNRLYFNAHAVGILLVTQATVCPLG